jgi:hypothetical protein
VWRCPYDHCRIKGLEQGLHDVALVGTRMARFGLSWVSLQAG